jgi:hypothetical protein
MEAPLTVDVKGRPCQEQLEIYRLALECGCIESLASLPTYACCPKMERYSISDYVLQARSKVRTGLSVSVTGIAQSLKQSIFKGLNAMNGPQGQMACVSINAISCYIIMSHNSGVIL